MPGRILTLQRQARELGRLRSGHTVNGEKGPRPVRSATWIVTSHNEDYVKAAAELWGGKPEKWEPLGNGAAQWRVITEVDAIDAIMPPGDPLSQTNELWTRGGIGRRCDGITDQITDSPCLCVAQFGEEFYKQSKDKRCSATSRLSLILPAMPDVGVFRVETKSFYAANEIAATVDVIRAATGGNSLVPVQVRIEPRTSISEGKTKQYPVIVLALRGATAGQILSDTAPGISTLSATHTSSPPPHLAIESSRPDAQSFADLALNVTTSAEVRELWKQAEAVLDVNVSFPVGEETRTMFLGTMLTTLGTKFAELEKSKPAPSDDGMESRVAAWTVVLSGFTGTTEQALELFGRASGGRQPADCSAVEIAAFGEMMAVPAQAEPEAPVLDEPGF